MPEPTPRTRQRLELFTTPVRAAPDRIVRRTPSSDAVWFRPGGWSSEAAVLAHGYRRATVTARTNPPVVAFRMHEVLELRFLRAIQSRLKTAASRVITGASPAPLSQPWDQPLPSGFSNMVAWACG